MSQRTPELAVADERLYTREEIRRRLYDRGLAIVDVLPRASYETAHIPNAISLPIADLPARAHDELPDLEQEIAIYCGGPT